MPSSGSLTLLLRDVAGGDKAALDRLVPLVYDELRRIAAGQLRREQPGHTLQPTDLVHEVYTRMLGQEQPEYRDRVHFYRVAAQVMRRILVDRARIRNAAKRGGGRDNLQIDEARDAAAERPEVMIALDDALNALEHRDRRKAQLIEMQYFAGLTAEESAAVLGVDIGVVRRELRFARAWLQREMDRGAAAPV